MNNLAARAGRWSASHWKTAVIGWIVFVVAAFSLTMLVKPRELTNAESSSGNSRVGEEIIANAGFPEQADESVIVQHPGLRADDPAFVAVVRDVAIRLDRTANVEALQAPLGRGSEGLISKDGRSALVNFQIPGSDGQTSERVGPILDQVRSLQRSHPGYVIEEFGGASANRELDATIGSDLRRAEQLSLPITLLVLVVAFGALVAASIPVLLAFTAVLATYGLSALTSHFVPGGDATSSVILLIGMAVGVDYSLFYLRREREEVAAGRDRASALRIAAGTSGQAVLISGATVIVAMAGMLLAGDGTFSSIAVGTMTVVLVTMVGSLTVLPALLSKLGNRVERGRIPLLGRRRGGSHGRQQASGVWSRVLDRVLRRPLVSAVSATVVLLLLAVPALGLRTKTMGLSDLPQNLPTIKTYQRIQAAFPGSSVPAVVAVQAADVTAPRVRAAIDDLHHRAIASGRMSEPVQVRINPSRTVALVEVPLQGDGEDRASVQALQTLRSELIPATVGSLEGVRVGVTGDTAGTRDFSDLLRQRAPLVFAFVLGLAFILLLVTFRSIVIPIKSILLNLLSVAASYGVLVAVFQHGWGASLVGASTGPITSWLPLFLFVVLFGLSMDYHIFILSRVKELVDRGEPTIRAVELGIKATAGTVTSAAAVMVAVFAIFGGLRLIDIKQLGIGLAIAVLLDATIIRGVLLPAAMALLGEWNWYLPRWLQWLPRAAHRDRVPVSSGADGVRGAADPEGSGEPQGGAPVDQVAGDHDGGEPALQPARLP